MAEEEKEAISKKYKNKGWKDLETLAGEVSSMTDHEARIEHTKHIIRGYNESHTLHEERRAPILNLMAGDKAEEMQNIYKGLDEAHKNKKGDLEHKVVVDWLKKFADAIMPVMGRGAEGETEGNYNNMMMYLEQFDMIHPEKRRGETLAKVRAFIEKGHGFEASAEIIEAMKFVKNHQQLTNFMDLLLPPSDTKHRLAAAKKIADDVNEHLKKEKNDYRVDPALLGEDIVGVYQSYASGNFKSIVDYNKSKSKQR